MNKAYKGESSLVLATIVNSKNKGMIGQKLILKDNGDLIGDISDESLIKTISKEAPELMNFGTCKTIEEGEVQIFIEGITTDLVLLIAGGGHVGKAIAPLAKSSGFKVWIADDT